ncbi:MAG: hypothetical protein Q4D87_01405 [Actinomycetaceae bacterium]|nr:hypothetical protein [Actinomycetaceae bacterium]
MHQVEKHNEYIVTFEGQTPQEAGSRYFISPDYEYAKSEAIKAAYDLRLDPDQIRIFYRIAVTLNTKWVEVDEDTNYEEVIKQIYDEFKDA